MSSPSHEPLAVNPQPRFDRNAGIEPLEDALRTETRLLNNLTLVLRRQRAGVAADNLETVDDTVHDAQRILLTLAEARRRRRGLMDLLVGTEEVSIAELSEVLGPRMTSGLDTVREELRASARALANELEINRRVLQTAVRTGDEMLRAMCGAPFEEVLYGPAAHDESVRGGGGILINRRV